MNLVVFVKKRTCKDCKVLVGCRNEWKCWKVREDVCLMIWKKKLLVEFGSGKGLRMNGQGGKRLGMVGLGEKRRSMGCWMYATIRQGRIRSSRVSSTGIRLVLVIWRETRC